MGKQSPKIKPGEQPGRVNSSNWKRVSSGNPGGFEKTQEDKGRSFKEMCGADGSQELQENKGNRNPSREFKDFRADEEKDRSRRGQHWAAGSAEGSLHGRRPSGGGGPGLPPGRGRGEGSSQEGGREGLAFSGRGRSLSHSAPRSRGGLGSLTATGFACPQLADVTCSLQRDMQNQACSEWLKLHLLGCI